MDDTVAVLALPEGWVLDRHARARLERQLGRAASPFSAVAAEWSELPPGTSDRVFAERRALLRETEVQPLDDQWIRGAAVIRPGVPVEVGDDGVKVCRGQLLIDRGTVVHDPWHPIGELADASPEGRPLANRPVALFLGFARDPYLADWVRTLVNHLQRRDVEGRIAVPEPTEGLHLTKPCGPTEASVGALAPDVIVALDPAAAEQGLAWTGGGCALVRLTPDTTATVTIERVRMGWWGRRLEARIGRGVDAASMADLVRRLRSPRDP
jgi:hypothetical protein